MTFCINIRVLNFRNVTRCKIKRVSIVHYPVIRGVTQSNNHSTTSFGPSLLVVCYGEGGTTPIRCSVASFLGLVFSLSCFGCQSI